MPTIKVTRRLAEVMLRLKGGGRILYLKWRYGDPTYIVTRTSTGYSTGEDTHIDLELLKELKRLKLIEETRHPFHRPVRKAWGLTTAGLNFRIPPEEFWVNE
jgi:uncharacterized protein YjhX (UPF0386 family)